MHQELLQDSEAELNVSLRVTNIKSRVIRPVSQVC